MPASSSLIPGRTATIRWRLFALATCWLLSASGLAGGCRSSAPPHQRPPPSVRVDQVTAAEVPEQSEYVATIRSRDAAEVRAEVTGNVLAIHVASGDRVRAGENLIDIDRREEQAAVDRAEAATDAAAASLEEARAALDALRAQQRAREADVEYAQQQRDRMRDLFAADNTSRQAYDEATANLRRAEADLGAIEAQISAQEATIRSQRAAVAQSRSGVAEGQAQLDHYDVEAPISGVLGDIPVRVGDLVTPSTLLTTVESGQGLEVYVQVPVERLPRLRLGQEIQLLDSAREVIATTRVDFIAPAVDPVTQTILVKGAVEPSASVTTGSFVHARLIWERIEGPTVPTTAIRRVNTQAFVFVLHEGQPPTVEQRPVRLGVLWNQRYLVVDGLSAGETVVVAGVQRLGDGSPVTVERVSEGSGEGQSAARSAGTGSGAGVP